jgi:hypothetical protein
MKKVILFELASFILLISTITFSGCLSDIDTGQLFINVKDQYECVKYSNQGYIWVSGDCCLDSNKNQRCDGHEKDAQTLCDDECNPATINCLGDNKRVFYDCVRKTDGCYDLEARGMMIGKCDIECLSNSDCRSDERCFNYKCEKDRCGNNECGSFENCVDCPSDCLKSNQVCCNKIPLEGNCCEDKDCKSEELCLSNKCTPKCGNGVCDSDENCNSCSVDCLTATQICCANMTYTGNCCLDSNCSENQTCISHICTISIIINESLIG